MRKEEIKKLIHNYNIGHKSLEAISASECVKSVQPTGYISTHTCQVQDEYRINFVDGEQVVFMGIRRNEDDEIIRISDPDKMSKEELEAFEKEVDEFWRGFGM
ncbi:MAG: hypothetical protein SOR93_06535 [Clostridiales Family XIII bacterium]|uniref:Uncharacterized protein n=3 Tax=Bacteria TaxID=2 RepID=A0A9J6QZP5_9FIRM|nr:hypothetical protein [Hominibacterium faecale]MCI7300451.1 hypothetical protein [Clostridia bacterium]MCU7380960.1 hypothetical protein [Hominibacterium faecale]MDY3010911.1 hypothetical protein [Clostridiales Family XIII bacterium]